MNQKHTIFITFDRVLFVLACAVLVCAFIVTPKKKIVFKRSVLTFALWQDAESENLSGIQKLIAEFESENPAVKINTETFSKEEFTRRIFETPDSADVSRPTFDIVMLDAYWIPALIRQRYLRKLDDFTFSPPVIAENGEKNGASNGEPGGEKKFAGTDDIYAVPLVSFERFLFYNIALLQAAGYDRPPKTQSDFYSICKKMSADAMNVYGSAFSVDVWTDCFPWIWQAGINIDRLTAAGGPDGITAETFFRDKQVQAQMAFLQQLNSEQLLLPFSFSFDMEKKIKAFGTGKVAMVILPVSVIKRLQTYNGLSFNLTTVPSPATYSGKPVFSLQTWFAGIPASSENAGNAVLFLEFLAGKRAALARITGALPVQDDTQSSPQEKPTETPEDVIYTKAKNLSANAERIEDYYMFDSISTVEMMLAEEIRREK